MKLPKKARRIVITVVVIGVAAFFYSVYRGLTDVSSGEGVSSVDWLPATAHNVSFFKSYLRTAYEFDIPEADFLKWASEYKIEKIGDKPASIGTYRGARRISQPPKPLDRSATTRQLIEMQRQRAEEAKTDMAVVSRGWFYFKEYPNGGRTIVAYDSDKGRAYYWVTTR